VANDKHRTSVLIPRSKTLNSFKTSLRRQGKGKTNWLKKIISSILPPTEGLWVPEGSDDVGGVCDDVDELCNLASQVARWMIVAIAKMHGDAFVQAADDLGMPINSEKVGPEEFLAMSHKANMMRVRAQCVVQKYLLDKGLRELPTERAMHELGKDALLPCTKKVKIGTQVYSYSHMKLDELVRQLVCDNFDPRMNNLEIVIGGDHGQGAFRSPIKLVFLYADNDEKNN